MTSDSCPTPSAAPPSDAIRAASHDLGARPRLLLDRRKNSDFCGCSSSSWPRVREPSCGPRVCDSSTPWALGPGPPPSRERERQPRIKLPRASRVCSVPHGLRAVTRQSCW
jgi:hypothetical protein